ncbi:MAG: zf-HC2 domain-containing protein [Bryobacteraceae bacterium]
MDHPSTRLLARYALGEIADDAELAAFEEHLLGCEECRRKAVAVDLIGTVPMQGDDRPALHIAARPSELPVALCGIDGSRNIISEMLLPGLDASVVCPRCLALLRGGTGQKGQCVN